MGAEKRPDWMTSISGVVNTDDYLLGRKIDKTFELGQQEQVERSKEARAELLARDKLKLVEDPILELERRRHELKMEIISNPIKLRQLRERLLREDREKGITSTSKATERQPNSPPRRQSNNPKRGGERESINLTKRHRKTIDDRRRESPGYQDYVRGGSPYEGHRNKRQNIDLKKREDSVRKSEHHSKRFMRDRRSPSSSSSSSDIISRRHRRREESSEDRQQTSRRDKSRRDTYRYDASRYRTEYSNRNHRPNSTAERRRE